MIYKLGSKGLNVARIQMMLRAFGGYDGLITGVLDDRSVAAVKAYQRHRNLVADGIVGPQTMATLTTEKTNWLLLFLHCAATPEGRPNTAADIVAVHTLPVEKGGRGWSRPGYSDIIELDGKLVNIRDWNQDNALNEWETTFGVHGSILMNVNARHVCYIGGMTKDMKAVKDTRTAEQLDTMRVYIEFALKRNPNLIIAGHNQVQQKGCPSFNVPNYLRSIGVAEYNIANWGKMYE